MPAAQTMTRELSDDLKAADAQAREAYANLTKVKDAIKAKGPEAVKAMASDAESDDFKAFDAAGKEYDSARQKAETIKDRMLRIAEVEGVVAPVDEPDPKAGAREIADAMMRKNPVARVLESDEYKALCAHLKRSDSAVIGQHFIGELMNRETLRDQIKNLVTGASDTSAGAFVITDRKGELIDLPRRARSILNLVSVSTTNSDKIDWVRQTSRPTSAAGVAEATSDANGLKPTGSMAWEIVSADVITIAEGLPLTRRAARDAGRVQSMIEDELIYDLFLKIENLMLTGDGTTGTQFLGIENTSGIGAYDLGDSGAADETDVDAIHRAITIGRLVEEEPDAVMLNPEKWEDIRLDKDDNGNYHYGPPSSAGDMQVWGKPIVMTNAQAADRALVGNFRRGAELSFNGGVQTFIADQHSDWMLRNLLLILTEVAAAFLVKRPDCFTVVDFEP